jgi:hypothetical protein
MTSKSTLKGPLGWLCPDNGDRQEFHERESCAEGPAHGTLKRGFLAYLTGAAIAVRLFACSADFL